MAQVKLRIVGLYFSEIVQMDGEGPWTVRQVMDQYVNNTPAGRPKLAYEVQASADTADENDSVLTISVDHRDPDTGNTFDFNFVSPNAAETGFAATPTTSLGGAKRRDGIYRLQETVLDGGSVVVAWQFYVVGNFGNGPTKSATDPRAPNAGAKTNFVPFGKLEPGQNEVVDGDVVIWRMVAIRRGPIADFESPESFSSVPMA
jgi:hypothetical protein